MALFPKHKIGLFISFNSAGGGGVYGDVLRDFVDHYFPEENGSTDTLQMGQEQLQRFTGSYRPNRYPHERFTYVMALLGSSEVTADNQMLKTMEDGEANYWFAVDSLTLIMGYYTYKIWQNHESGMWSRMWYSLLFVLSVTLIWQLYYWNLLGFQY